MTPVKNKKTELYSEPEVQDITPVSVVHVQGTSPGDENEEGSDNDNPGGEGGGLG